ncbi:MAG: helix-turn-helix domain-containing protein [Proteobacteria bacterium]|nr:helix-turn-helix domain-containing protein [Pseudomonadota bacterium]
MRASKQRHHTDDKAGIGGEQLLNTAQTATLLGIKPNTLRIWRVNGRGPRYFRFGDSLKSQVRYRLSAVESWLADRSFSSTSEETAGVGQ